MAITSFATVEEYVADEQRQVRRWERVFSAVWIIVGALLISILLWQPAGAAPLADATVTTTVSRVYPFERNGAAYCNIGLANMTTLTNVFGPECQARRGQRVTLHYADSVRDTVVCNLWGCRTAKKTVRTLLSWYLIP